LVSGLKSLNVLHVVYLVLELLNNPMEINATQRLAWLNTGIVDICSITDITIVMSKCPQHFVR
jgi:Tfp pilus assembly protein PilZ